MARDGRCWTTTKHLAWLNAALPFYLTALPNNGLNKYLPPTYERWFIDFPEPQAKLEDYRASEDVQSDSETENEPPSDNDERAVAMNLKRKGKRASASRKKKCLKVSKSLVYLFYNIIESIAALSRRD